MFRNSIYALIAATVSVSALSATQAAAHEGARPEIRYQSLPFDQNSERKPDSKKARESEGPDFDRRLPKSFYRDAEVFPPLRFKIDGNTGR